MRFETGIKTKIGGMKDIKRISEEIGKIKGVDAVYLFGSYGPETCLCVITNEENEDIKKYNREDLKIIMFNKLPSMIRFRIFRYGKPLLINDKNFLDQLKADTWREYLDFEPFLERMCKGKFGCSIDEYLTGHGALMEIIKK